MEILHSDGDKEKSKAAHSSQDGVNLQQSMKEKFTFLVEDLVTI
jgi:hypothetical protein